MKINGTCTKLLYKKVHEGRITVLEISSDGKYMITGSEDKQVKIIGLQNLDVIRILKGH